MTWRNDDYDALPQAPSMMPLTRRGWRKVKLAEIARRAHAEEAIANLKALPVAEVAWFAGHGLDVRREIMRHEVQLLMAIEYH